MPRKTIPLNPYSNFANELVKLFGEDYEVTTQPLKGTNNQRMFIKDRNRPADVLPLDVSIAGHGPAGPVYQVASETGGGSGYLFNPVMRRIYDVTGEQPQIKTEVFSSASYLAKSVREAFELRQRGRATDVASAFGSVAAKGSTGLPAALPTPWNTTGWTSQTMVERMHLLNMTYDYNRQAYEKTGKKNYGYRQSAPYESEALQNDYYTNVQYGIGAINPKVGLTWSTLRQWTMLPGTSGMLEHAGWTHSNYGYGRPGEQVATDSNTLLPRDPTKWFSKESIATGGTQVRPFTWQTVKGKKILSEIQPGTISDSHRDPYALSNVLYANENQPRAFETSDLLLDRTPFAGAQIYHGANNELDAATYGVPRSRKVEISAIPQFTDLRALLRPDESGNLPLQLRSGVLNRRFVGGAGKINLGEIGGQPINVIGSRSSNTIFQRMELNIPAYYDRTTGAAAPGLSDENPNIVETTQLASELRKAYGINVRRQGRLRTFLTATGIGETGQKWRDSIKAGLIPTGLGDQSIQFGGMNLPVSRITGEVKTPGLISYNFFGSRTPGEIRGILGDWASSVGTTEAQSLVSYWESQYGSKQGPLGMNWDKMANYYNGKAGYTGSAALSGSQLATSIFSKVFLEPGANSEQNLRNLSMYRAGQVPNVEWTAGGMNPQTFEVFRQTGIRSIMNDQGVSQEEAAKIYQQRIWMDENQNYRQRAGNDAFWIGGIGVGQVAEFSGRSGFNAESMLALASAYPRLAQISGLDPATGPNMGRVASALSGMYAFTSFQKAAMQGNSIRPGKFIEMDDAKSEALLGLIRSTDISGMKDEEFASKMSEVLGSGNTMIRFGRTGAYLPGPEDVAALQHSVFGKNVGGILRAYRKAFVNAAEQNLMAQDEPISIADAHKGIEPFFNMVNGIVSSGGEAYKKIFNRGATNAWGGRYMTMLGLGPDEMWLPEGERRRMFTQMGFKGKRLDKALEDFEAMGGTSGVMIRWPAGTREESLVGVRMLTDKQMEERYGAEKWASMRNDSKLQNMSYVGPGLAIAGAGDWDADPAVGVFALRNIGGKLTKDEQAEMEVDSQRMSTWEQLADREQAIFSDEKLRNRVNAIYDASSGTFNAEGKNLLKKVISGEKGYSLGKVIEAVQNTNLSKSKGMPWSYNVRRAMVSGMAALNYPAEQISKAMSGMAAIYQPHLDQYNMGAESAGTPLAAMIGGARFNYHYERGASLQIRTNRPGSKATYVNLDNWDKAGGLQSLAVAMAGEAASPTELPTGEKYNLLGKEQFSAMFALPGEMDKLSGMLGDDRSKWAFNYSSYLSGKFENHRGSTQADVEARADIRRQFSSIPMVNAVMTRAWAKAEQYRGKKGDNTFGEMMMRGAQAFGDASPHMRKLLNASAAYDMIQRKHSGAPPAQWIRDAAEIYDPGSVEGKQIREYASRMNISVRSPEEIYEQDRATNIQKQLPEEVMAALESNFDVDMNNVQEIPLDSSPKADNPPPAGAPPSQPPGGGPPAAIYAPEPPGGGKGNNGNRTTFPPKRYTPREANDLIRAAYTRMTKNRGLVEKSYSRLMGHLGATGQLLENSLNPDLAFGVGLAGEGGVLNSALAQLPLASQKAIRGVSKTMDLASKGLKAYWQNRDAINSPEIEAMAQSLQSAMDPESDSGRILAQMSFIGKAGELGPVNPLALNQLGALSQDPAYKEMSTNLRNAGLTSGKGMTKAQWRKAMDAQFARAPLYGSMLREASENVKALGKDVELPDDLREMANVAERYGVSKLPKEPGELFHFDRDQRTQLAQLQDKERASMEKIQKLDSGEASALRDLGVAQRDRITALNKEKEALNDVREQTTKLIRSIQREGLQKEFSSLQEKELTVGLDAKESARFATVAGKLASIKKEEYVEDQQAEIARQSKGIGGALRHMLGGFGLMYMRSIAGVITSGLDQGQQEAIAYQEAIAKQTNAAFGTRAVAYNQQLALKNAQGAYGTSVSAMSALQMMRAKSPLTNDIMSAAGAGLGGYAATMWAAGEFPALAGAAVPIGLALAGASVFASGWQQSQDPTSLAYRRSLPFGGGPSSWLGQMMLPGGRGDNWASNFANNTANVLSFGLTGGARVEAGSPQAENMAQTEWYKNMRKKIEAGPISWNEAAFTSSGSATATTSPEFLMSGLSLLAQEQPGGDMYTPESHAASIAYLKRRERLGGQYASWTFQQEQSIAADFQTGINSLGLSRQMLGGLGYNLSNMYGLTGTGTPRDIQMTEFMRSKNLSAEQREALLQGVDYAGKLEGVRYLTNIGSGFGGSEFDPNKLFGYYNTLSRIAGTAGGNAYAASMSSWAQSRQAGLALAAPEVNNYEGMSEGQSYKAIASANAVSAQAQYRLGIQSQQMAQSYRFGNYALGNQIYDVFQGIQPGREWTMNRMLNADPMMLAQMAQMGNINLSNLPGATLLNGNTLNANYLAFTDVSNNGRVTGLGWGTTGLGMGNLSAQTMGSKIFGGASNAAISAAVNGVSLKNGITLGDGTTVSSLGGSLGLQYYGMQQDIMFQQRGFDLQQQQLNASIGYTRATWGIQDQQRALSNAYQQQQFGFQQRGFEQNFAYQEQMFDIQGRQRDTNWAQQLWGFGFQQRQIDLARQNWDANTALDTRQRDLQRGWQREDWTRQAGFMAVDIAFARSGWEREAGYRQTDQVWQREDWGYADQTRGMQWGWKQEDYAENVRFTSGRQRKLAERQMQRDTTLRNMEEEQIGKTRSRQEELWKRQEEEINIQQERQEELWKRQEEEFNRTIARTEELWRLEDERFQLGKSQHEQELAMRQEQLDKAIEFAEQDKALQDEMFELQKSHFYEQMALQQEQMDAARRYYEESLALEQQLIDLSRSHQELQWKFQQEQLDLAKEQAQVQNELREAMFQLNTASQLMAGQLQTIADDGLEAFREGIVKVYNDVQKFYDYVNSQSVSFGGDDPYAHADGGPLAPGVVNRVGENGFEYVINGRVIPHEESVAMQAAGIVPGTPSYMVAGSTATQVQSGPQMLNLVINIGERHIKSMILDVVNSNMEAKI